MIMGLDFGFFSVVRRERVADILSFFASLIVAMVPVDVKNNPLTAR